MLLSVSPFLPCVLLALANTIPGAQGGRDQDYARKQWNGLVRDYYAARARLYLKQALEDAKAGLPLNKTTMDAKLAQCVFVWLVGMLLGSCCLFLFCFVLFCFVLFCFVLFCLLLCLALLALLVERSHVNAASDANIDTFASCFVWFV